MKWLRENGCKWGKRTLSAAIKKGNLEVLQWMRGVYLRNWSDERVMETALLEGRLEVVEWLLGWGATLPSVACEMIASTGDLEKLKWVCERGGKVSQDIAWQAVLRGHTEIVRWMKERKAIDDFWLHHDVVETVAAAGHWEMLRWLMFEEGIRSNDATLCIFIARKGDIELLRRARDEAGCTWTKSTCTSAAMHGHLELLTWLIENGCPWDPQECLAAASTPPPQPHVIAWIQQHKERMD